MKPHVFGTGSRRVIGVMLVAAAAALAGCAGRYGSTRWDNAVGMSFDDANVLPGHRYYAWGPETWPDGILAVRSERPVSGLWHETAMTPEILARLVARMRDTRTASPDGYAIIDDRGERIGAWYSYFPPPSTVKILDDGGVMIPHPFKQDEDGPHNLKR